MFLLQYSQGFCFSVDCSSNLTSNILQKTCCLKLLLLVTQVSRSHINMHQLHTAPFLSPPETGITKALPAHVAQLCILQRSFQSLNLVLVLITLITLALLNVLMAVELTMFFCISFSCQNCWSPCKLHFSVLNPPPCLHFQGHTTMWLGT